MNTRFLLLAPAVAALVPMTSPAFAESQFEHDLQQLKQQHEKALEDAAEPINRRYKDALEQLLRRATQGNALDDAVTIRAELETLGLPSATTNTANATAKPVRQAIQANAPHGVELGPMAKGTPITIQYVEGKWYLQYTKDPLNWVSPDEAPAKPPEERFSNSLAIFSIENGKAVLLELVPPNTKKHPFHYHFKKDYQMVILRIRDEIPEDNQGFAVYDVTVGK